MLFYSDWHVTGHLQEELGTEYLVRPVGRAEDEEDASDFEPGEETDEDEDIIEADNSDFGGTGSVKDGTSSKRKRSAKDDSDDEDDGDEERPSKR